MGSFEQPIGNRYYPPGGARTITIVKSPIGRNFLLMLFYVAGPIDLASDIDYRGELIQYLNNKGVSTFNPKDAFNVMTMNEPRDMQALMNINKHAMLQCHGSVIVLDSTKVSIGTPIELYIAHEESHPNLVIWIAPEERPTPSYVTALADKVVRIEDVHEISSSHVHRAIDDFINRLEKPRSIAGFIST